MRTPHFFHLRQTSGGQSEQRQFLVQDGRRLRDRRIPLGALLEERAPDPQGSSRALPRRRLVNPSSAPVHAQEPRAMDEGLGGDPFPGQQKLLFSKYNHLIVEKEDGRIVSRGRWTQAFSSGSHGSRPLTSQRRRPKTEGTKAKAKATRL